jgi:5-(carboxyamino)imidazole ribonucleotide mutase
MKVAVIMGSKSDLPVMQAAIDTLALFEIETEVDGAGGAAHLPGMVASTSPLPVIGVPVKSSNSIDGWDSVLSILQMPGGVPVATVALNGAKNAALLACQILGVKNPALREAMIAYKASMGEQVHQSAKDINKK